jgi:putative DNA primase/helicase
LAVCAPAIINGIPDLARAADLADRAVFLHLTSMPDAARRSEAEFWGAFEAAAPRILGALLDGVARAIADRDEIEELIGERAKPRMLDFAIWGEAAAGAFGWPRWAWLEAYTANRAEAAELTLEADAVAVAVRALIEESGPFYGTMTELLAALEKVTPERTRKQRGWPQDATRLSGRLRRAAPMLRRCGLAVDLDIREGKTRTRKVEIRARS